MSSKLLFLAIVASVAVSFAQAQPEQPMAGADQKQLSLVSKGAQDSLPFLVRFTDTLRGVQGAGSTPVNLAFALYNEETGGNALWSETQNVTLDSHGRFTVFLGAASTGGIPPSVFASGEARWLGIAPAEGVEGPRVMLVSVPYAFEAANAQTIGGHAAGEFVTRGEFESYLRRPPVGLSPRVCYPNPCVIQSSATKAGSFEATASTGPSFISDAETGPPFQVQSSGMVQNLNVDFLHGLADSAFAKLASNNQFALLQQFGGGALFPALPGNGSSAQSSNPVDFQAVGISNASLISQTFRWQANGANPNVPQAQLGLSFGSSSQTPQPTGFSFNSDGTINFAPNQPFPGTAIMSAITPLLQSAGYGLGNGGTGGGSGGTITGAPVGSQPITQPPGTSTNINTLNNVRTVVASDNWQVSNIPIALVAGVQATVTLTPCPRGVDTTGSPILGGPNGGYPIRITDLVQPNTNSESAYVVGGTCTSMASTGTIIFTPYFSHSASAFTLGSASTGIQEAINDACGINVVWFQNSNCQVDIPPTGPQSQTGTHSGYDVFDTIYFHTNNSVLSGNATILNCRGRGPCIQVGDLLNANHYANDTIQGISFRALDDHSSDPAFSGSLIQSTQRLGGTFTIQTAKPHNFRTGDRVTQMLTDTVNYWGDVPSIVVTDPTHYTYQRANTADLQNQTTPGAVALSYEAVLDNGNSTSLVSLQYENTYENGKFNHFFDFWDDENAQVNQFNNNSINLNGNLNWTGSFVWSGGALNLPNANQQLAPVITLNNLNITAVGANCVTVHNSNGVNIQNTTCQAQGPWEVMVSNVTGNLSGASFQNIYSEASLATNPPGTVTTNPPRSPWPGLGIGGFIGGATAGSYNFSGEGSFAGLLPTVGSGSTTYVYYAVARDITTGKQTSPLPFMYEQENSPSQVPVQWPRVSAGTDTILYDIIRNPAPAGTMLAAAGAYVAPYTGGCNGGSASACGAVAVGVAQCSGFVCNFTDNTGNATAPYTINPGNFIANPTFWPGTATLTSTALQSVNEMQATGIAFNGTPTEIASTCSENGANVSGGYTECINSPTTAAQQVPNQPALILTDGPVAGGGGVPGAKGRLIIETTSGICEPYFHSIITLFDSNPAKTQATTGHRPVADPGDMFLGMDPNCNLMMGGGAQGMTWYLNNIGDGANWLEHLSSSGHVFKVPVQAPTVNATNGFQVNGSYGSPGQVLMSSGTGSYWGSCPNTSSSQARQALQSHSGSHSARTTALLRDNPVPEDGAGATEDWKTVPKTVSSVSFSSAIANASCTQSTLRWNGVTESDGLLAGWPTNLNPGLIGSVYVSAADTVTVRVCNLSGTSQTLGKLTLKLALARHAFSAD